MLGPLRHSKAYSWRLTWVCLAAPLTCPLSPPPLHASTPGHWELRDCDLPGGPGARGGAGGEEGSSTRRNAAGCRGEETGGEVGEGDGEEQEEEEDEGMVLIEGVVEEDVTLPANSTSTHTFKPVRGRRC